MAAFSRLDLGPNLRTGLGPEYFSNLLTVCATQLPPAKRCPTDIAKSQIDARFGDPPGL